MKKLACVVVLAVCALLVTAWYAQRRLGALAAVPATTLELEQALAQPGLIALGTLNVSGLAELERWRFGQPTRSTTAADPADDSWIARLRRLGIDPGRDLTHVTAAVRSTDAGDADVSLGLFGHFAPEAVAEALEEQDQFEAEQSEIAGQEVWRFVVYDRDTCETSGPWALHLSPERLLLARPESMAGILARLETQAPASRDLEPFRAFRGGRLVAGAVFVPNELPDTGHPLVSLSAHAARDQLDAFRAVYLGMGFELAPPGFRLASRLEANDAAVATEAAERWSSTLKASRSSWEGRSPTLAELHDALSVRSQGHAVLVELDLGTQAMDKLGELPQELLGLLFGASGSGFAGNPGGSDEERIDEDPLVFASELREDSVPAYDPQAPFHGPADAIAGPFGVRISAVRAPEAATGGAQLEIEALAGALPNHGDRGGRAFLHVTRSVDAAGRDVLAHPACGPSRPGLDVELSRSFGSSWSAKKVVHLVPGARTSELAQLEGRVRLLLPTRTEVVRIAPEPGSVVERADARLEITGAGARSVAYHVSGAGKRLLHVRALNGRGQPLQRMGSTQTESLGGGGGSSGSIDFAGAVATLEAVFAVEERELEYPFSLSSARPGSDGEHTLTAADAMPLDPMAAQWRDSLAEWLDGLVEQAASAVERAVDGSDEPRAVDRSGPFVVTLESVWSFGGLMPRLEVHAPPIDPLDGSLAGMELALEEIRLLDGSVHRPDGSTQPAAWSELVQLSRNQASGELEGSVQLETRVRAAGDELASLHGTLHVRLPRAVSTRELGSLEPGERLSGDDLDVRLLELGRDRFVLQARAGIERIVAARAYNANGEQLWIPFAQLKHADDGGWNASFQVKGTPQRIELVLGESISTARFPFSLVLAQPVPAAFRD